MNEYITTLKNTQSLNDILFTGIIILLLVIVTYRVGLSKGKRKVFQKENQGESFVRNLLTEYCKKSTAHVLNNVTLEHDDGTTQIDHILITQNGIIVIETKHYKGWIFANENQKYWTQVLFKVKFKFQNPIFQNFKHLVATQKLLDFMPEKEIISLVVFTGEAQFKTLVPKNVIHVDSLIDYIDNIRLGSISENRVQFCVGRLECKRLELTGKTDVEHQDYLLKKFHKKS